MNIITRTMAAVGMAMITGCATIPSVSSVERSSTAIGISAGMVANRINISDKTKGHIVEVTDALATVTPGEGVKFADVWTPIAEDMTERMVGEGKINKAEALVITEVVDIACVGLDYLFDVRFPEIRVHSELVTAAVRGFTTGFRSVFDADAGEGTSRCISADSEASLFIGERARALRSADKAR